MKIIAILLILTLSMGVIPLTPSFAHQSGCHRWHSCPSDSGSYVCGDLGYDTYCPKTTKSETKDKVQTKTESKPKTEIKPTSTKCTGTALCITDKVTKIIDGDTLYTTNYKIRLSLTNTPEKDQTGFSEAMSFTKKLCPVGSILLFDQDDKQKIDKFGRVLGKVFCSDKNLNAELLNNNHAKISKEYCSVSEFSGESWAKYGCTTKSQETKSQIPKETPKPSLSKVQKCDPSYPDVCIPPYPPDLDCGEISYKNFRVVGSDPHGFDRDNDGIGCEK